MHRRALENARVRELRPDDEAAARALVRAVVAGTGHGSSCQDTLGVALSGGSEEMRGVVADHEDRMVGLALFGMIAGAAGTGRLHLLAIDPPLRRRGIGMGLADAADQALLNQGARVVIVELPDDPSFDAAKAFLRHRGFSVEARVADYYRDGVDLAILRRVLADG